MSLSPSQAAQKSDLFYKQSKNCPVIGSGDLALINLHHFLKGRAALSRQTVPVNKETVGLEKGQLIFGRFSAMRATGLTESVVRTRMKKLVELGQIKKVSHKDGKLGYSIYQVLPFSGPGLRQLSTAIKPLCQTPSKSSVSTTHVSTKERGKPLKEKTYSKKRKVPLSTQLTEQDVCLSHPLIFQNDKHGLLNRFGEDFLRFLLEKAKCYASDPTNPIGLLIHLLRTGAYAGQYADLQNERKRTQGNLEAMKRMEQEKERARQRQKEAQILALKRSSELIELDLEFRNQVKAKISSTFRLMKSFLSKVFQGDFTIDDVLTNPRALSYYSEDLLEILALRGEFIRG